MDDRSIKKHTENIYVCPGLVFLSLIAEYCTQAALGRYDRFMDELPKLESRNVSYQLSAEKDCPQKPRNSSMSNLFKRLRART